MWPGDPLRSRGAFTEPSPSCARSFTATRATTRLHVVATVSQDQVHDGLHGDVFAIGGSFAGTEGSGFFALAIGRRIDVRVTER